MPKVTRVYVPHDEAAARRRAVVAMKANPQPQDGVHFVAVEDLAWFKKRAQTVRDLMLLDPSEAYYQLDALIGLPKHYRVRRDEAEMVEFLRKRAEDKRAWVEAQGGLDALRAKGPSLR